MRRPESSVRAVRMRLPCVLSTWAAAELRISRPEVACSWKVRSTISRSVSMLEKSRLNVAVSLILPPSGSLAPWLPVAPRAPRGCRVRWMAQRRFCVARNCDAPGGGPSKIIPVKAREARSNGVARVELGEVFLQEEVLEGQVFHNVERLAVLGP